MTIETLEKLNDIFQNREEASDLEGVFSNYKEDKNVIVLMSIDDYEEYFGTAPIKKYPLNSAFHIPEELLARIYKVIDDYEKEMYNTLSSVKVDNLPWKKEVTNEM